MDGVEADLDNSASLGFVDELLPEWSDDWILIERERLRQIGLHGLETLSARLSDTGRHAAAVEAALLAVACEPLRETAQRALIVAHLAEGNAIEASRAFDTYTKLLDEALGITPGQDVVAMVAHIRR
jgi:DNA-binding SARP family transcriptional activator